MPQLIEPESANDGPEAQRAVIRLVLDEIAAEVGTALRDALLDFPVFLTVPNSGHSIATTASPLDPCQRSSVGSSGNDWETFGCADGHYSAPSRMQRWAPPM